MSHQPPPPTLRDSCILPTHPPPSTIRDLWCLSRPSPMMSLPTPPPHLHSETHGVFPEPPPPHLPSETHGVFPNPPTYHQRPMVSFPIPLPTIRDPWRLPLTPPPPERWVPSLYDSFDHFSYETAVKRLPSFLAVARI